MSAIGSSVASTGQPAHPGKAALRSEITRYQQQLAECINCPSSKTPQGKANIQKLSDEISADKAKLHQTENSAARAGRAAPTARESATYTRSGTAAAANGAPHGMLVDTYA